MTKHINNLKILLEARRELRNNPTPEEDALWQELRNSRLGYKFRRQHSIGNFIADFYCAEEKLVVELDGKIHEFQKEYDLWRTSVINELGMRILRINNEDAFDENLVTNRIRSMFTKLTPRPPLFKKRGGDSPFQTSF